MGEIIFEEVRCGKCKLRLVDLLDAEFHNDPGRRKDFYRCSLGSVHEFTQISSSPRSKRRDNDMRFLASVDRLFDLMSEWGLSLEEVVEAATAAAIRRQIIDRGKGPDVF